MMENGLQNLQNLQNHTFVLICIHNLKDIKHFFTILFEDMNGVNQYQIVQKSLKELEVKIVVNSNFSVKHEKIIIRLDPVTL